MNRVVLTSLVNIERQKIANYVITKCVVKTNKNNSFSSSYISRLENDLEQKRPLKRPLA